MITIAELFFFWGGGWGGGVGGFLSMEYKFQKNNVGSGGGTLSTHCWIRMLEASNFKDNFQRNRIEICINVTILCKI